MAVFFSISCTAVAHPSFSPITTIPNEDSQYSLINSIDFHPRENIFCAAYTHNNKILIYQIDENGRTIVIQTLSNPQAKLSEPQHAVFSPDGEKLAVANWANQTLNIYLRRLNGLFSPMPDAITPPLKLFKRCKPHGMAFSPCGNYLAIAYGAACYFERAIALFRCEKNHFKCVSFLKNKDLPGIPKGIAFSPDGTHLLVTFCDPSGLSIFSIIQEKITFRQALQGPHTKLSRPEDIKISPDGYYCAITNSNRNTVTFYLFNQISNSISESAPFWTLQNPEAKLCFPHGIAFSSNGKYLAVTQFGSVKVTGPGDIVWKKHMNAEEAAINLYRTESFFKSSL